MMPGPGTRMSALLIVPMVSGMAEPGASERSPKQFLARRWSQRQLPGGGLDVALLLWRQGEFNSMEVGFSMPVGLGATAQSWTDLAY